MNHYIVVVVLCMFVSRYWKECRSDSASKQVTTGTTSLNGTDVFGDSFAGGIVSVDCLRCLCLTNSNCDLPSEEEECIMFDSVQTCGYFRITSDYWIDCGRLGTDDWKKCANNVRCSSLCVQKYMERYARQYNCNLNCEGFTREHFGGPNGCNRENTLAYWENVQKEPGCKGVE